MSAQPSPWRRAVRLLAVLPPAAAWIMLGQTPQAPPAPKEDPGAASQQQPAAAAKEQPAATYAGSEICQACHEDISTQFQKNRHHWIETAAKHKKWNGQACESCHGPGSKHTESGDPNDILQPAKLSPARADKVCLTCHLNEPTQAGRVHGGHARSAVACVSCHSVHGEPRASALTCTGCHANNWAQFNRPFGHDLGRNSMTCTDCHNPHGGFVAQSMQRTFSMRAFGSNEPGCFRCHGNLRGPFTFEHAPVRLGGCTACHEPHNSTNPRMLTRHEIRFTCLECHSNLSALTPTPDPNTLGGPVPPAFHDLSNPRFRECTVCHVKIHGSHANRSLLR